MADRYLPISLTKMEWPTTRPWNCWPRRRKIDAAARGDGHRDRDGMRTESVCSALGAAYPEVWKIDNAALAYPNAEIVRKAAGQRAARPVPSF